MQNIAREASSQPCQDLALHDAALQEMLETIDSSDLSKCKHEKELGPESSFLYIRVGMSYMIAR